jgi:hypothetical protein
MSRALKLYSGFGGGAGLDNVVVEPVDHAPVALFDHPAPQLQGIGELPVIEGEVPVEQSEAVPSFAQR